MIDTEDIGRGSGAAEVLAGALDHFVAGCLQLGGLRERLIRRMARDGDPAGGCGLMADTLGNFLHSHGHPLVEELVFLEALPDLADASADEVGELQIWLRWTAGIVRRLAIQVHRQARPLSALPPAEADGEGTPEDDAAPLARALAEVVPALGRRMAHLVLELERWAAAEPGRPPAAHESGEVERLEAALREPGAGGPPGVAAVRVSP